tara:strand:- start:196 stop:384 length:189 start_codon:yes stop_codon:yes gene_type:complete
MQEMLIEIQYIAIAGISQPTARTMRGWFDSLEQHDCEGMSPNRFLIVHWEKLVLFQPNACLL